MSRWVPFRHTLEVHVPQHLVGSCWYAAFSEKKKKLKGNGGEKGGRRWIPPNVRNLGRRLGHGRRILWLRRPQGPEKAKKNKNKNLPQPEGVWSGGVKVQPLPLSHSQIQMGIVNSPVDELSRVKKETDDKTPWNISIICSRKTKMGKLTKQSA